jgi:hypothetical protein
MREPISRAVRVGDAVLVESPGTDWWVGHVIHREGSSRCNTNSSFQIACVDTGVIRTVNADCVTAIIESPVGGTSQGLSISACGHGFAGLNRLCPHAAHDSGDCCPVAPAAALRVVHRSPCDGHRHTDRVGFDG